MEPTVFFVHGTTVRNTAPYVAKITDGLSRVLNWSEPRVIGIEWGQAVGPDDLSIGPALPPEFRSRELNGDEPAPDETDEDAALWKVLIADPDAELRVMTVAQSPNIKADPTLISPTAFEQGALEHLTVDETLLTAAGLTDADVRAARDDVVKSETFQSVAASDWSAEIVAEPVARAIVARLLRPSGGGEIDLPLAYSAHLRDQLVKSIADQIAAGRWIGSDIAKRVLAEIATRVAMQTRANFMGPLTDFIRDVAYYIRNGKEMRDYVEGQIRDRADGIPSVVIGHSLGGIGCVDLLAGDVGKSLGVRLLVTAGSQAPYLYLLDALHTFRTPKPGRPSNPSPFQPWLNVYDRKDMLSFCASEVFGGGGITDVAVNSGVPFPDSHSAYFGNDEFYEALRNRLAQ